jgi:hypothetical protein
MFVMRITTLTKRLNLLTRTKGIINMTTGTIDFSAWTKATGDLQWGVQRALYETLGAVAQDGVKLVYGTDSYDGSPCLINAVANMLALDVNAVSPASWFPSVVAEFDRINKDLWVRGVNPETYMVSETAAEILMANFGPLKPVPTEEEFKAAAAEHLAAVEANRPYVEPSDAEFADMLAASDNVPSPTDVVDEPLTTEFPVGEMEPAAAYFGKGSNVRVIN